MPKLSVFDSVSLDGYFSGPNGDYSFAHARDGDPEWDRFTADNASGSTGTMIFGRKTYELMVAWWPTAKAKETMPKIAETMNRRPKLVFSRTLKSPDWNNTRVVAADPVEEVRRLKAQGQDDMIIMGSGSIVAQLTEAGLIDQYEIVVVPVIVGEGRTLFEHVMHPPKLNLTESRAFANGNVFLRYETAAA